MKNMTEGKIFQKIITILLIFVMLSSYLPMLVVFAEDTNENDYADKIVLGVNWQGGDTSIAGTTANTYTLEYNLKFNGVPTGFTDVQMYINTDKISNVYDSVNAKANSSADFIENGTYSCIDFGDKNTGVELGGSASVKFGNDGKQHERKVTVTVVGKYTDPQTKEEVSFKVEKSLNATITPETQITNYESILRMQQNSIGTTINERLEPNWIDMGMSEYNRTLGWYATSVKAIYPIHIDSYVYTQKLELNVTINRLVNNESKLETGYSINWGGLDTVLGNPTETVNSDGSITYKFTKGEDAEQLIKDNTFSINRDFDVIIVYTIPNSNPKTEGTDALKEDYTTCLFKAEMETIGFKVEKEYDKNEVVTKENKISSLNKENSTSLYEYTPGNNAWIRVNIATSGSSYLEQEDINKFVENRTLDLAFITSVDNSRNWGDKTHGEGKVIFNTPKITYLADTGKIVTTTLTAEQMRLKAVKGTNNLGESDLHYGPFVDENLKRISNTEYNSPDDLINTYQIVMYDYLYNYFYGHEVIYTINADELGLSDTELANILTISIDIGTNGQWCKGSDTACYYNTNSIGNKYSYMEMDVGDDFSSDVSQKNIPESKKITLKMYKNTKVMKTKENYVVNENPIFYVNLPSGFKYKNIDVNITNNSSISMDEENLDIIRINGEQYLVIPCIGIYDSSKLGEVDIDISFTRTLESASNIGNCTIDAYMLTDNERYIYEKTNTLGLSKGERIPEKAFATSVSYNISESKEIIAETRVKKMNGENFFEPNPSDNVITQAEKESPMIVDSNGKVIYGSVLKCVGDTLKDIKIISKLPIANNTYIDNSDIKLIEDEYKLPYSFYDNFTVRGFNKGDIITQTSLQNLNNIEVYLENMSNDSRETISEDNYTIYYTTQENVNFETNETAFVEYVKGESDLSQAKNIKVVFNDTYELKSGYKIVVQYEMTMPDEPGMVGAVTATQYVKSGDTNPTTLYSPAAYVINGNTKGNVVIKKKFEGYSVGVAPSGVSLSGIEFKLQYYDEEDGTKKFLQDSTGVDIVAITDENGIAKFSNIPYGEYYLYEVTEFDNYSGIGNLQIINLDAGQTINYVAENKLKRGNITINKEWEDTNYQQGKVLFTVQRVNSSGENVSFKPVAVTTDESGVAVVENIPYGTYNITETIGKDGWYAKDSPQDVVLNEKNKETTFVNIPGKAVLQIVKTVPEGETVDGLKFHITGIGKINYINKEGEQVDTNTDITVTIGEDYSSVNNISIIKSENDTKATITINDLYLGLYSIEEIEIPVIEGTNIEKYVKASSRVNLNVHDLNNPVIVNLKNNYKTGTLEIQKTAKLKEGDTYTDIGDLSSFKVRITGTSFYGNEIDRTITLDENGYGVAKLEIGNYTVTEVAEEGYTTYYGENNQASTTPPTVAINYNKTTTQKLYNEHTGVGYVRVEKTLEGKTDPQKVIDAGIEFKVVGQNVAGGRVEKTIKIDKIDTEKNVAYGVSEPIPSGGEYQLEEVESTIPEFFEGIEPVVVDLKTSHTTQTPLVIKAENKRAKGDLEIITQTDPIGGPLVGITYRVTEVEVNKNGTYTKIGNSVELEGNNDTINTSFAELKDINAGYYLVEQLTVPNGWEKDVSQIVEVPNYNIGYANFEITEIKKLQQNKVKINKVILNSQDEIATEDELEKAELNKNESFEIKLTNIDTKEVFYVFTSTEEPGVIQGLEPGTYKIEEIYKPKYITEGYYNNIEVEPNDIEGLNIDSEYVEEKIIKTDGEYLFTIEQNGNSIKDVELTIKNKINTSFGFGGQTLVDNLSKVNVEEDMHISTKAVIYVVDENNNAISGVKFKLINEQGKVIVLNNKGEEFEVSDKKLTIKGLPVGKYTLTCTQYPDGYLKADDKEIIVYSDAVQVAKVEVQKNVPRGTMLLSTVYKTEDNETKYIPRSKYKIVNESTGELVKFIRTATGDYKKSNLDDASPLIVLKSGPVEIEGIEVGNYEVGIVDVTKGYGIQSELPENVTIEENATENVSVEVINKEIVQVAAGQNSSMYLNESGELFIVGYAYGGAFGNGKEEDINSQFTKIEFPENVQISKFSYNNQSVVAIDTEGRIWSWGRNYNGQLGNNSTTTITTPTCITELDTLHGEYYNEGTRFVDVQVVSDENTLLLDNKGRVWVSGYNLGDGTSNQSLIPKILQQDVTVKKLGRSSGNSSGVIDSLGRVWIWGRNNVLGTGSQILTPLCFSDISDMKNVEIEDLVITKTYAIALDSNGDIWLWGTSGPVESQMLQGVKTVPTKVDSSFFGNAKIKLIAGSSDGYRSMDYAIAVDEFGRVWTWGVGATGELGNGECGYSAPICISDDETENLYGVEIKDIAVPYDNNYTTHIIALDTNNRIWSWGGFSYYYQSGNKSDAPITIPQIVTTAYNEHLEYNVKFKEVFTGSYAESFAIDEEGRVWVWGSNSYSQLGIDTLDSRIVNPAVLNIPGNPKMKKVSSYYEQTIMLSEDGNVFICGMGGYTGNGKTASDIAITEITDNFNLPENVKIIDVCTGDSAYIALDSEGKVYTWGNKQSSCLGRTDKENSLTIECISDDNNEALKDIKIVKLSVDYDDIYALDNKGNLYNWGNSSTPKRINIIYETKYTDIQGQYLLDTNGKIWIIDRNIVCISDKPSNPLYKNYQIDSEYKIIKIYKSGNGSSAILKDSNGDLWGCEYTNVFKLKGLVSLAGYTVNADLMPKDIISASGWLLVDKYGQIWVYKNIGNTNGEAGNGTITPITKPIYLSANANSVINIPEDNNLYGVKIKKLVNDKFIIDENDNIWYFTTSGSATNLSIEYQGNTNPLYSKEISEVINSEYVITADNQIWYIGGDFPGYVMEAMSVECEYVVKNFNQVEYEYYIALDANGKLWSCGANVNGALGNGAYTTNKKLVCLNDIEGTELYNAYADDANFKIEKILYAHNDIILAVDNSGKLWAWGDNSNGKLGSGNTDNILSPICISNIEDTDLCNAYKNDSTMKIVEIGADGNYIIDSNGEIWCIDENTYTFKRFRDIKATGDLAQAYNDDNNFKVSRIIFRDVIGNNGKVYYFDDYADKYKIVNGVTGITDMYGRYNTISGRRGSSSWKEYNRYIIYGSDGVFGIIKEYSWNYGTLTSCNVTASKISTCNNIEKAIEIDNQRMLGLDSTGKIWLGSYKNLGFTCLSNLTSYQLYEKTIQDMEKIGSSLLATSSILATDSEGNLYKLDNTATPVLFTMYDEIIEKLYGEVNTENRKEFARFLNKYNIETETSRNIGLFKNETGMYKLEYLDSELTCTQVSYTQEFIGGIGKIEKVVGENEIQTVDGTIYKIIPTDSSSFVIEKTTEITPIENTEIDPVEIEGANIVKQTKYKALDDKGNLYVWDCYTGLSSVSNEIVCLTNEKYYIEPIYSNSNGWSVIKNQF